MFKGKFFIISLEDLKGEKLEYAEWEGNRLILGDGIPYFIILEDEKVIPTIYCLLKYPPREYYITVDMGAVPHIVNGADVMAPGIVEAWEGIKEGDFVWVRDEKYHKPICVGTSLMPSEEILKRRKGKAVKNLHYVGDKIWDNLIKG